MVAKDKVFLAVDLGASSGRVVAGRFDGQRLALDEVHRFPNGPVTAQGTMYWDVLRLWSDIQDGLRSAGQQFPGAIASVAVDTWGVDFGLLDRDDCLIGNPVHYRDPRTAGVMASSFVTVSRADIFAQTGLQFMELNTLYQVIAMRRANAAALEHARAFLMMPDLFHWLLTGVKSNEMTNATTTQFYNPVKRDWARELLACFDIPTDILQPIEQPGTVLGGVTREVAQATGLNGAQVVLPGTHDTASAVMAVPTEQTPSAKPNWCYISSGTWSLMGAEVTEPVISSACAEFNFTNEGGIGGTIRLLKNIGGLWLVQECRRIWEQEGKPYDWDALVAAAAAAEPLTAAVNPDDPRFLSPPDMPAAIQEFCQQTGQSVPDTHGAIIRVALESLALRYRQVLGWLEQLTGSTMEVIHIVGGGTRNRMLCQMAADACRRKVVAGPVEATAIGNLLVQMVASGDVGTTAEARRLIRQSFEVEEFEPNNPDPWDDAFYRFEKIARS